MKATFNKLTAVTIEPGDFEFKVVFYRSPGDVPAHVTSYKVPFAHARSIQYIFRHILKWHESSWLYKNGKIAVTFYS